MNWAEFVTEVTDRLGPDSLNPNEEVQAQITAAIIDGVVDLQRRVKQLRTGHEQKYAQADGTLVSPNVYGFAFPEGYVSAEHFFFQEALIDSECFDNETQSPSKPHPLNWVEWPSLESSSSPLGWSIRFEGSPDFAVRGPFRSEHDRVVLIWTGIKESFLDADTVPFTTDCARAVALFVKSETVIGHKEKRVLSKEFNQKYNDAVRAIYLKTKDRNESL